jgi:hypothetical protein
MDDQHSGAAGFGCYSAKRFNEKGCLLVWGGDALKLLSAHTLDFIVHLSSSFF